MTSSLSTKPAWIYRPLYLGHSLVESRVGAVRVALEVADGGGFMPSLGMWRIAGRVVHFVDAGEA